ncbi:MAG: TolC family outer membrane protein [Sulfuriferula sp.]|nr:TolC family outer membrane protein [Sulfuriferula sp.]
MPELTRAILLLMLIWVPSAFAGELSRLYQDALNHDADYAASLANYRAGLEKLPQARSALLPQIQLNANALQNRTDLSIAPVQNYSSNSASVNVTQPLFRQANLSQYEQAKQQSHANVALLDSKQQDLILRVASAYFDVLLAQDNLYVLQSLKTAIDRQLALAKANFAAGTSTVTDSDEAQARSDLTAAQLISAQNDLYIKQQSLSVLTGTPPIMLAGLDKQRPLPPVALNQLDNWITEAVQNNPQIRIEQANMKIAEAEITRARSGHLPTLDAVASYTDNRNQLFGNTFINSRSGNIGLALNIPLYQGGLVDSRIREAEANKDKASQELLASSRQIELGIRQAAYNTNSQAAQVTAYTQAVNAALTSLESSKLGLTVGVRTNIDVLNAQQQYYAAQRDLAAARYGYWLAKLRLKANEGALNETDLAAIN